MAGFWLLVAALFWLVVVALFWLWVVAQICQASGFIAAIYKLVFWLSCGSVLATTCGSVLPLSCGSVLATSQIWLRRGGAKPHAIMKIKNSKYQELIQSDSIPKVLLLLWLQFQATYISTSL